MAIIPELGRLKQKDLEFRVSVGFHGMTLFLKENKNPEGPERWLSS